MSDGASWGDSKEYKEAQTRASRNPFAGISDPATLLTMVQDGVKCEECGGTGGTWDCPCPDCTVGKTPLPNPDLDALAACWCEGKWLQWNPDRGPLNRDMNWHAWIGEYFYPIKGVHYDYCPTTSPDAAMRLMIKYNIIPSWLKDNPQTAEELCRALTEAALVAALTEMEGASE